MDPPNVNRKYTDAEKQQLIANLDIEVAHRTRQFESWLADGLENFNVHQEGHVSRIPKQVRNMTMREFGEKYQGNIQAALRGFQKEKFAGEGEGLRETDKTTRKRKWVASQDVDEGGSGSGSGTLPAAAESSRTVKNARLTATPKKKPGSSTGPGTAQRARLLAAGNKTPGTSRTMGRVGPSSSPQKSKTVSSSVHPARPTSPSKHLASKPLHARQPHPPPPPSSATFNAAFLPPKTPIYPGTAMRLPRRDESMLSLNGSPLANPYELGLGWFGGIERELTADGAGEERKGQAKVNGTETDRTLKRTKSNIIIHRDTPFAATVNGNTVSGLHSRTNSQTSVYTSSQAESSNHSRTNSQSTEPRSQPEQIQTSVYPSQQLNLKYLHTTTTPKPPPTHARALSHIASALVAIPTKDGQFIEFDPLQTSPGALDALEGITDSAKKQARMEMGRLVQAAVDKWKIG